MHLGSRPTASAPDAMHTQGCSKNAMGPSEQPTRIDRKPRARRTGGVVRAGMQQQDGPLRRLTQVLQHALSPGFASTARKRSQSQLCKQLHTKAQRAGVKSVPRIVAVMHPG